MTESDSSRVKFKPTFTSRDLKQLDILHGCVGLGSEWLSSEKRQEIADREKTYNGGSAMYNTNAVLQWATAQAARYGKLVSSLGDRGMKDDYRRTRAAWVRFKTQFNGTVYENAVMDAFCEGFLSV